MGQIFQYRYRGVPAKLHYPDTFQMPSENERDRRWQAIRESMAKHDTDFLVVTAPHGYMPMMPAYLTYVSNYVPFASTGNYLLFTLKEEPMLAVTGELGPQYLHIARETSWIEDVAMGRDPVEDIAERVKRLGLERGKGGIIGYASGMFPAVALDALRKSLPDVRFEDATAVLCEAMDEVTRSSEEELALLKKACQILDSSFEAIAGSLVPGVTEQDLWAAAENAIIKNGGWYSHFMIAGTGPGPMFMRAPAAPRILQKGDVAVFEINTIYGGISPQASFALSLGSPAGEVGRMFGLCEELYGWTLAKLGEGITFGEIESELIGCIRTAGYEPETPQMHVFNASFVMPMEKPPRPGDYFTMHPNMCNAEYTLGAKFGDCVRISGDGRAERLNRTAPRLHIV